MDRSKLHFFTEVAMSINDTLKKEAPQFQLGQLLPYLALVLSECPSQHFATMSSIPESPYYAALDPGCDGRVLSSVNQRDYLVRQWTLLDWQQLYIEYSVDISVILNMARVDGAEDVFRENMRLEQLIKKLIWKHEKAIKDERSNQKQMQQELEAKRTRDLEVQKLELDSAHARALKEREDELERKHALALKTALDAQQRNLDAVRKSELAALQEKLDTEHGLALKAALEAQQLELENATRGERERLEKKHTAELDAQRRDLDAAHKSELAALKEALRAFSSIS